VARTLADYVLDDGANGRIWLAERDDQLVGCTALILREGNRGQIRWVLVNPSARGIGLGKKLMDRAMAWGRERGCKVLFLETTDGLPESQTLYENLGFEVVYNQPEKLWDKVRPLIKMELALP
jgi:N-acetylglutamate synthase-like GNAT family acetyltransferase